MHRLYENEDLAVFWDSEKCFHARVCRKTSPEVFNPERRPWIDLSRGDNPQIWQAANGCPSGALSVIYTHGIRVEFDKENRRSIALDKDRIIGECDYRETPEGWEIIHTEVLPEYSGKGIAKRLVYKVIEAAERDCHKIIPLCSYATAVLKETE